MNPVRRSEARRDASPRVFIGSSAEAAPLAAAVKDEIEKGPTRYPELALLETRTWDLMDTAQTVFESLITASAAYDFAIFVFAPDDKVLSRGEEQTAPRDNVVYELGLFTGALGSGQTFVLAAQGVELKLPSDLAGVIRYPYKHPRASDFNSLRSAVQGRCNEIVDKIADRFNLAQEEASPMRASYEKGSEFLALEVYGNLQGGYLESFPSVGPAVGRTVVHAHYGIGRAISVGPGDLSDVVVVQFEKGPLSVPAAELHLTTRRS